MTILSPVACATSYRLTTALARKAPPGIDLHVLGATFNDLRLMGNGSIFAGGPVAPSDFAEAVARQAPSALVLPYRMGQFFILEAVRAAHDCRSAYFDWSGGRFEGGARDLCLDPALDDEGAAERILSWYWGEAGAADTAA